MDKISILYVVKKCGPVGCEQNACQPRSVLKGAIYAISESFKDSYTDRPGYSALN